MHGRVIERAILEALRERPMRFSELRALALSQGTNAATFKRCLAPLKAQGLIVRQPDGLYRYLNAVHEPSEPTNLNAPYVLAGFTHISDIQRTQAPFQLPSGNLG